MPMGRPKPLLLLGPEESEQLRAVASSRTLPHGLVLRARIILLSASGMNNQAIAARLCLNPVTVGHWRKRFLQQGLAGLHGELRPGRPRSISDERVAALVRKTLRAGPQHGTHWSCRSLAVSRLASRKPRGTAFGELSDSSRIGSAISSCPTIPSSSRRCGISWVCI